MANQRRDLRSEDARQEEDPRSKARGHPRGRDRSVADPPRRREDAAAEMLSLAHVQETRQKTPKRQ